MQMTPAQCIQKLEVGEFPRLLMLFGDEHQQKLDVIDKWREVAKIQQFEERHTFVADGEFEWQQLHTAANTLSLFSEKQTIELNLPTGKPGTVGSAALIEWMTNNLSDDVALLLHGPLVNQSVKNAKWFKTLEKHATVCFCYELKGHQMVQYLSRYVKQINLAISDDALNAIADMNEGNLLAAKQEIDKLELLFPNRENITLSNLQNVLSIHSRYSIFELAETTLVGDMQKAVLILDRLEQEGIEPNIVIWQLISEVQKLQSCLYEQTNLGRINFSKLRIWQSKQRLYTGALKRLSKTDLDNIMSNLTSADTLFKTEKVEQPFVLLAHLCLLFLPVELKGISLV